MKKTPITYLNVFILSALLITCNNQKIIELKNEDFSLRLGVNQQNLPVIESGKWLKDGQNAFNNINQIALEDWFTKDFLTAAGKICKEQPLWEIEQSGYFLRAKAKKNFANLTVSWIVELPPKGSMFRMRLKIHNKSENNISIRRFPVWSSDWNINSKHPDKLHYFNSLTYTPLTKIIERDSAIVLASRVYSSDRDKEGGHLPFWRLTNDNRSLFFSLSWCGGWKANIQKRDKSNRVKIFLPEEETQLILKSGETVSGPILNICADNNTNQVISRQHWLKQRNDLSGLLYHQPKTFFPLIYNHWYAVRFNLSSNFIEKQLAVMNAYNFDVFVIDAGWYNRVGDWQADTTKFKKGAFENSMEKIYEKGIIPGIWSCPWLLTVKSDSLPGIIDSPPFYNKFMNAYTMDLAGMDFTSYLNSHITGLKQRYFIGWWKYDQELFGLHSRAGKMKNVTALQQALASVRKSFPKLNIENCMSGGRMINEFTDQIAQSHWIRDGGGSGIKHARSNIKEALGAIEFLSPAKVQRWTNRPNELDKNNSELLKYYCRSAMIGVWGISADLHKIGLRQKKTIIKEIENYRELNRYKKSLKYEIFYPYENSDIAGVIFYKQNNSEAAILIFRWNKEGAFSKTIKLPFINKAVYKITDIDLNETVMQNIDQSFTFQFTDKRLSAIYFMKKADN
jgi:hypothetical protein